MFKPEIAQDMYPVPGDGMGYTSHKRFSPGIHIPGDRGRNVTVTAKRSVLRTKRASQT